MNMRDFLKVVVRSLVIVIALMAGISALSGLAIEFNLANHWENLTASQRTAVGATILAVLGVHLAERLTRWLLPVRGQHLRAAPNGGVAVLKGTVGYSKRRVDDLELEPKQDTDRLTVASVHEAGHAAVALDLGFTLREASVIPDEVSGGRVAILNHPAGNRSNQAFWSKAVMACAGVEAELELLGHSEAAGGANDMLEVHDLCNALAGVNYSPTGEVLTAQELITEAQRQARESVIAHLPHIDAISNQLQSKKQLNGRELAELFDKVDEGLAA